MLFVFVLGQTIDKLRAAVGAYTYSQLLVRHKQQRTIPRPQTHATTNKHHTYTHHIWLHLFPCSENTVMAPKPQELLRDV